MKADSRAETISKSCWPAVNSVDTFAITYPSDQADHSNQLDLYCEGDEPSSSEMWPLWLA